MKEPLVLIIEDEEFIRESLCEILSLNGYKPVAFATGEEGVESLGGSDYDIVITDLRLPGMNGIDVVREVKEVSPHTACIILTGYASVESAVEAMRVGAYTYIKKPFGKDELLIIMGNAYELSSLKVENRKLKNEIKHSRTDAIMGTSPEIESVRALIDKVADTDTTVLILGDSGTGKELVSKALHYGSSRADKPFVPINCGAIPEDLLESELFGYEKGAFTGAIATKIGRFEAADKGTVFLDEIGDMSPGLQIKILRVLQEKEFERVGGLKTIKVDVRIVAATNQDLDLAVEEKRFRKDLYYRLNVIPIHLPPLRDRSGDVPLLVKEFMDKICERKKKSLKGITPEAMKLFEDYDWPGNIRELENLIERIVVLKDDNTRVTPVDLPEKIRKRHVEIGPALFNIPTEGIDFNYAVKTFEKELIINALSAVGGVKKKAAEFLKLNRTTLIEKMKRMDLIERSKATKVSEKVSRAR
jgi:DNA-binding NtrC family response regulator